MPARDGLGRFPPSRIVVAMSAQEVLGFGQRFVPRGAVRGTPHEIREYDHKPAVFVAFNLGGIVVGIRHAFGPPGTYPSFRLLEIVPVDPKFGEHRAGQSLADRLLPVLDGRSAIARVERFMRAPRRRKPRNVPPGSATRPLADLRDELPANHARHSVSRRRCPSRIDVHMFGRNNLLPTFA